MPGNPIPPEAREAYRAQVDNARRRGIPFLFTFEEWWAWWQRDGRWERRGHGMGKLCMARKGDIGPYSPENVYCATHEQNLRDAVHQNEKSRAAALVEIRRRVAAGTHHLQGRGDKHPSSRAVITPLGRFGSAALAAEAFGIGRQYAAKKARLGLAGWHYETTK